MKYLLLGLTLFLSACAPYAPKPDPMKNGLINPLESASAVGLLNDQSQSEPRIERFGGIPVNLQATTEETLKMLSEQWRLNGVTVEPAAPKQLKLAVQELYQFMASPPFTEICIVRARLSANNGMSKALSVKNASGVDIFHACNFALTKLVAEIVNDPDVRSFLAE
jgi:hypothetical protein